MAGELYPETANSSLFLTVNDSAWMSADGERDSLQDQTSWPISMCFLSIAFGVFGAVGNSLVILVFFSVSVLNTTDVLVLALAINDLVGSGVVVPMDVWMYWTSFAGLQNVGVCMFYHIVFYMVFTQSNSLLMEIAVDRFFLVCFPFESYLTNSLCVKLIICGLLVSIALGTLTGLASCVPNVHMTVIMFISDWLMVVVMCLTIVSITASYTAIYFAIRNHKMKMIRNATMARVGSSKLVAATHKTTHVHSSVPFPSSAKDEASAAVTKNTAFNGNFSDPKDESCASGRYEVKHPLGRAGKVAEVDLVHTTTAQELTEVAQSRLVKRSSDLLVPIGRCEQGQESRRSLQLTGKRDDRMHAAMDRNYHRANLMACDGVEIEMFAEVHTESSTDFESCVHKYVTEGNEVGELSGSRMRNEQNEVKEFSVSTVGDEIEEKKQLILKSHSTEILRAGQTAVKQNEIVKQQEDGNICGTINSNEGKSSFRIKLLGRIKRENRKSVGKAASVSGNIGINIRRHENQQQRVALMMFVVTIVFLIGCTPNFLLLLQLQLKWMENFVFEPFLPLTNACYHFTFAANPVIYAALSSKFREQTAQFYQVHVRNCFFKRPM